MAALTEPASVIDNYTNVMAHRSQAYGNRGSIKNEDRPLFEDMAKGETSDYQTLYRRSTTEVHVGFDDFQMIHIIGKGTFGKVSNHLNQNSSLLGLSGSKQIHKAALRHEKHQKGHCH